MARRLLRGLGTLLIVSGVAVLGWAALVWAWQDPFTYALEWRHQRQLAEAYERRSDDFAATARAVWGEAAFRPRAGSSGAGEEGEGGEATPTSAPAPAVDREAIRGLAREFRRQLDEGDVVGRLRIERLGLSVYIVNGTDTDTLKRGPGRYDASFVPGEGQLVYVAGHRTTYGAPFSRIDELRPGDRVTIDMPYGRFVYRIVGHRIVDANDLSVLRSPGREVIALQACHPRFFATERYIAYARPVETLPPVA